MSIQLIRGSSTNPQRSRLVIEIRETSLTVTSFLEETQDRWINEVAGPPASFEDVKDRFTEPNEGNAKSGLLEYFGSNTRVVFDDVSKVDVPRKVIEEEVFEETVGEGEEVKVIERRIPVAKDVILSLSPVFVAVGKTTFFLDGRYGLDEIVPFSIIDIMLDAKGCPKPWVNRFIGTAAGKIGYSERWRSQNEARIACSLFLPFVGERIVDHHLQVNADDLDPIMNIAADNIVYEAELPPVGVGLWKEQFWHAVAFTEGQITAGKDELVEIPVHLRWNADGSLCSESK